MRIDHNPRTGLRTNILSFTEGSTRLELMEQREQSQACMRFVEAFSVRSLIITIFAKKK